MGLQLIDISESVCEVVHELRTVSGSETSTASSVSSADTFIHLNGLNASKKLHKVIIRYLKIFLVFILILRIFRYFPENSEKTYQIDFAEV